MKWTDGSESGTDREAAHSAYNTSEMRAMTDYDLEGLAAELAAWEFKPSHAPKLMREFYEFPGGKLLEGEWDRGLGNALMAKLRQSIVQRRSRVIGRHGSDDGTVKLLLGLDRGGAVESVLMPAYDPTRAAG